MPQLIKLAANSLAEYVATVIRINQDEDGSVWYRGHSSASHRLLPNVLRDTIPLRDQFGRKLCGDEQLNAGGNTVAGLSAERMLDEFKRRARPFLDTMPRNDFEWLFLMQHYGTPTRLLDWTTNALVALYFAIENLSPKANSSEPDAVEDFLDNNEMRDDGFAVFCINPEKLNKEMHGISYPVDIAEAGEEWLPYTRPMESSQLDTYAPICILAPHNSPRIRAQSGTFTLHGENIWPLDFYDVLRPQIYKIFMPYGCLEQLRNELRGIGFTTSFIYPDLSGISREIKVNEMMVYEQKRKVWLGGEPGDV